MKNLKIRTNTNKFGAKVFALIFFGIFTTIGLVGVYQFGVEAVAHVSTYSWTATQCEIVHQPARPSSTGDGKFQLDMRYRYQVDGADLENSVITPGVTGYDQVREAEKLRYQFRQGKTVPCFYNPERPEESLLIRRSVFYPLIVLFPALFAAIGLGGLYGFFIYKGEGSSNTKTKSRAKASKADSRIFFYIFFGIFTLVGGLLFYFFGVRTFLGIYQARSWDAKDCTVVSSQVKSHSGDSTTYSIDIVYKYEADGEWLQSDRYDFLGGSSSGYQSKKDVVDQHPKEKIFTCYVDPKDPTEAVIDRDFSWTSLLALFPLLFLIAGVWGLHAAMRGKFGETGQDRRASRRMERGFRSHVGTQPVDKEGSSFSGSVEPTSGEIKLSANSSPIARLSGLIVITSVWDGVIGFIAYKAFLDSDAFSWGVLLFMIPFALVGIGLLIAIPFAFLALFHPKIELYLTPGTPRMGERMSLRWHVTGRAHWLEQIELKLVGQEEATYRRGTSTSTDRKVFYEKELTTARVKMGVTRGETNFDIPMSFVPSFSSSNNKIVWKVKLRGVIVKYPDVSEEFTFELLPAEERHFRRA